LSNLNNTIMDLSTAATTTKSPVATVKSDHPMVFRNAQVSKMYGVSEPTVYNWIISATEHKNQLELVEFRGKLCIVNSAHNLAEMQQLAEKGRKYRNKVPVKKIDISHFGGSRPDHIFEMLYNLQFRHSISYKSAFLRQSEPQFEKFFNTEMTLDSKFLQAKLLVQDSQQTWAGHLKRDNSVNLITTSFSCPYVYRSFIHDICQKRPVDSIKFVGMSDMETDVFRYVNQPFFEKSSTRANFRTFVADIDADPLWPIFDKERNQTNIVILLGEAFYDINFFVRTVRNINRTLTPGDFIITNINLSHAMHHTDFDMFNTDGSMEVMEGFIGQVGLERDEDYNFEYIYEDVDPSKKWYARTGSKKWYLNTTKEIHVHYSYDGVMKDFTWGKNTLIEIASWKLWQEDFPLEAAQLGYNVVSWNTNMEQTEAMVLMQKL